MRIDLTMPEVMQAAFVGIMRRVNALKSGWTDRYGSPQNAWNIDIEGCCAELVVAKALDVFWQGYSRSPRKLPGDVGQWQVRSTWRENGRLIVHDEDNDATVFVLVVGTAPSYRIAGWIRAIDAKKKEFWDSGDGRNAYFVPQSSLNPWSQRPVEPVDSELDNRLSG